MKLSSFRKRRFFGGGHLKSNNSSRRKLLVTADDHDRQDRVRVRIKRGCVPVYVGEEEKRYQVPVESVASPALMAIMKQTYGDDPYDATIKGPIKLPCTAKEFERTMRPAKF